ncbi:hypothetical protein FORC066_0720 [Yersinia enterocolitica]|nr:hypothetical protein FORC066_0720 [Yersinia enterocolitica]
MIRVSEGSQHPCSLKYDGYKTTVAYLTELGIRINAKNLQVQSLSR